MYVVPLYYCIVLHLSVAAAVDASAFTAAESR
jgi:hypothetical protein